MIFLLFFIVFNVFGSDYFNKFAACDENVSNELLACKTLFKDIVEEKKLDLRGLTTGGFISNSIYMPGLIRDSLVGIYFLNVDKLYNYFVKDKTHGKYILCFFGTLYVKKDANGLIKGNVYEHNNFDEHNGTFYIIPEGVLGVNKLSVVFEKSCGGYYFMPEYNNETIGSTFLCVDIIDYKKYEEQKKIFNLTNQKKVAEEIGDKELSIKTGEQLKKLLVDVKKDVPGPTIEGGPIEVSKPVKKTKGHIDVKKTKGPIGVSNPVKTLGTGGGPKGPTKQSCCC